MHTQKGKRRWKKGVSIKSRLEARSRMKSGKFQRFANSILHSIHSHAYIQQPSNIGVSLIARLQTGELSQGRSRPENVARGQGGGAGAVLLHEIYVAESREGEKARKKRGTDVNGNVSPLCIPLFFCCCEALTFKCLVKIRDDMSHFFFQRSMRKSSTKIHTSYIYSELLLFSYFGSKLFKN